MQKIRFENIAQGPFYTEFFRIKVKDRFRRIINSFQKEGETKEYKLVLDDMERCEHINVKGSDEFEYDFIEVRAKVKFVCDLCGDIIKEDYGAVFKASPDNIRNVIKELKDFCATYSNNIDKQHFHKCKKLTFGLMHPIGFNIGEHI